MRRSRRLHRVAGGVYRLTPVLLESPRPERIQRGQAQHAVGAQAPKQCDALVAWRCLLQCGKRGVAQFERFHLQQSHIPKLADHPIDVGEMAKSPGSCRRTSGLDRSSRTCEIPSATRARSDGSTRPSSSWPSTFRRTAVASSASPRTRRSKARTRGQCSRSRSSNRSSFQAIPDGPF
jgi:hypothetical protein